MVEVELASVGAAGSEEEAPLVSQEQSLKRERDANHVQISRAKLGSLVVTILVLFALMVTSNARDWQYYKSEVREEKNESVRCTLAISSDSFVASTASP